MSSDDEAISSDQCPCRLNLLTPSGKSTKLKKLLSYLMSWFDPTFDIVTISERFDDDAVPRVRLKEKEDGRLVTPCLSVMLFVRERGVQSFHDYQAYLQKDPWHFHHMVELQSTSSPQHPIGKQEFYKLDDDLPLWAVCPSNEERLRLNLYVNRYPEMVEFYRAVTEVEMESSKPEFCIFQLHQQPGLLVQLSLKHSPFLFPVKVESSCLSFQIRDVTTVSAGTNCYIEEVEENVYTTRDPDGNLVILYETLSSGQGPSRRRKLRALAENGEDSKSFKSSSDSHDSGRCSDLEVTSSEVEVLRNGKRQLSIKKDASMTANSNKGKPPVKNDAARQAQNKNTGEATKGTEVTSKGTGAQNKALSAQSKDLSTLKREPAQTKEGKQEGKDDINTRKSNITPVYI